MKTSLILVLALTFYAVISFGFKPNQDKKPWVAPESAKEIKNPVEATKKSIKEGQQIFKQRCVVCHGQEGKGDGPGSRALEPKPANLPSEKVQGQTDGEIFWKISNGRGPMVAWKNILSEENRWNLVNYVRTLDEN